MWRPSSLPPSSWGWIIRAPQRWKSLATTWARDLAGFSGWRRRTGFRRACQTLSAVGLQWMQWTSVVGWWGSEQATCKVYCFVEEDFLFGKMESGEKPSQDSDRRLKQVDVLENHLESRGQCMFCCLKTILITLLMSKLRLSFTQPCASLNSSFRFITWSLTTSNHIAKYE